MFDPESKSEGVLDRRRSLLKISFRPDVGLEGLSDFSLVLELADLRKERVANVRRCARRAKVPLAAARDQRQQVLFESVEKRASASLQGSDSHAPTERGHLQVASMRSEL